MKIDRRKYTTKPYLHFDSRISLNGEIFDKKVKNPTYVSRHAFYPFIHYTLKTRKYNRIERKSIEKKREIYYSGHLDGYILKYYGEKLNELYTKYCIDNGIDQVSIAYRNNKKGKSNIHFAYEVIQFITHLKKAIIIVTDFTEYFDTLDHQLLKDRLLTVLNIKDNRLPDDWWNVFKNITRYSWVEKKDIEEYIFATKGIKLNRKSSKLLNRYFTPREFRCFRKRFKIRKNEKKFGIPQGSPISAVFANVYAINIDKQLNDYTKKFGGLYRRYSDDIILVFPVHSDADIEYVEKHLNMLMSIVDENKVKISNEKTRVLYFANKRIYKDSQLKEKDKLDYLGFSFYGNKIQIREKSLFKYYHRMYKKISSIKKAEAQANYERKIGRKKLYLLYSHLGRKYKGYGNFISYAERAHKVFSKNELIESNIYNQVKRHWHKIHKRLNK